MGWTFVSMVNGGGQASPAGTITKPTGIADGDLEVLFVAASGAGFGDLGFIANDGWTAHSFPDHGVASTPTVYLTTRFKIASSQGNVSTPSLSGDTRFYQFVWAVWRWTLGTPTLSMVGTDYAGTYANQNAVASPANVVTGNYAPVGTDCLGITAIATRSGSGGAPILTPDAGLSTRATNAYDDGKLSLFVGDEAGGTFPSRTSVSTRGGTSSETGGLIAVDALPASGGAGAWAWLG